MLPALKDNMETLDKLVLECDKTLCKYITYWTEENGSMNGT